MRGNIIDFALFGQSKAFNHTGWNTILPRLITPSDIDMVIDNNGNLLFVEFKHNSASWDRIPRGQVRLYESIVKAGQGKQTAVLCQARAKDGELLDSVKDVMTFNVMRWYEGGILQSGIVDGSEWIPFVKRWFDNKL